MLTIGIRELRQNASRYIRLVKERGESIGITDRGHPVAVLAPLPAGSRIEQLAASGRLTRATLLWNELPPPLELAPGEKPPSKTLEELRADER